MMTDTERLILEKLDSLGREMGEVKAAVARAEEAAARAEEAAARAEETAGRAEIAAKRAEETARRAEESAARAEETAARAERMAAEAAKGVREMQLTLENEISRKIDIIGEGHDFLYHRFDEACLAIKRREMTELEVINLRMEVKKIKERLDIA